MNKFLSTLFAGAIGGLITFGAVRLLEKPAVPVVDTPAVAKQVYYGGAPVAFDFTKAAERSMSSVVHIKASESRKAATERLRDQRYSDPFQYFLGQGQYEQQPRSGTGSGVIYTADGYIITNNHVVEFADEYVVTLHDDREFKARLIGRDESTDMAIIKIDATDLPPIEIGNSDDVKVGEWVLAVGNPFDLTSTVTAGIVSAKARDIHIIKGSRGNSPIESFIQTDAAVNPGNSGGALVDVNGKLIGINSAIATPTGVFAGYSFAIPVNLVKRIVDDLISYGEYKRAYLGVNIATMNSSIAEQLEVPYTKGIVVTNLDPQGSAAQAGMQNLDVITGINGKTVTTSAELLELIGRSKIGETVDIKVVRSNKDLDFQVQLKTRSGQ